jgi:uncharacterized membrane protein YgcG
VNEAVTQFQQQFAEPVYGFVGEFWPFLLMIGFVITASLLTPRWRDQNGVIIDMTTEDDRSDGGGDGDGGGGDGGGGGD